MIVDERLVTYINSLDTGNTPILDEIEREALASFVPIIRKEMQSFLKVLLSIKRPKRILEVGTAVGFSAILMAEYDPVECEIITIENYEKRIPIARENFIRAEKEEQITLLEGDAKDVLETLTEPFDLIFMDAAKGQYLNFLPRVLELLQPEGILISDNVLQDGDIIESRFAVTRRNRTIHKRMREYLYTLTHSEELTTAVLPVGDGITISTERREEKHETSGIISAGEQLRSLENSRDIWSGCCLYRWRGIWTSGKGKEFYKWKRSKKALHLHMSMVSKFMLRQIF